MQEEVKCLLEKATAARQHAYAPYSNFRVGACIETVNGTTFASCNVENASYGLGICAESNTISAMVASGETVIKQLVVIVQGPGVSAPCGACRQRLHEFAAAETPIHLFDLEGNYEYHTLGELLPYAFGPNDLLPP